MDSRMRIEGTLSKWNDERGFGFITLNEGGQEVFVHISAFPKDAVRPTLGEKITFEVEIDSKGKKRAKNLVCSQRQKHVRTTTSPKSSSYRRNKSVGIFGRVLSLLILAGVGVYGYGEYSRRAEILPVTASVPKVQKTLPQYRCDGRTHCSHMTSCAEATFFLRNCPNVEMDGDHDGVPCEQQWCTNPFAE